MLPSQFSNLSNSNSQDFVTIGSGIEADLIALACLPVAIETSEPSVHFEEVKSDISNHLFLDNRGVTAWSDSVFDSQGFELFVSVEAVFNLLRNLITELLDLIDQ